MTRAENVARLLNPTRAISEAARKAVRNVVQPAPDGGGYTRFVGWMKLVLPLVAGLLVLLLVVWPQLEESTEGFRIGQSGLTLLDTGGQQVANALFTGTDNRNQPFAVTAQSAIQSESNSDAVELNLPKADLAMKDGSWIALAAKSGLYDKSAQSLELSGDVNMFQDGGYEFSTESARVMLKDGTVTGTEPIRGQGPFGLLKASGFRILDRGRRIIFTGRTQLTIFPQAKGGAAGGAKSGGAKK